MASILHSNGNWYNWPEDVANSRGSTGGTPADSKEVEWVYALSPALSCRLNASYDSTDILNGGNSEEVV